MLLCNFLARPAIGRTINAPNIAGKDATLHQTDVSIDIPVNQERSIPPRARDHEKRGGRGLIAIIG
jgi:hypothetical protein